MKRFFAIYMILYSFSRSFAAGDGVGNPADHIQADFVLAYTNMEIYIEEALRLKYFEAEEDIQIAKKVLENLPKEKTNRNQLIFLNTIEDAEVCVIEEGHNLACTGTDIGSPIYLNTKLFYHKDDRGRLIPLVTFASAVQILFHELGHHIPLVGPRSHATLNKVGAIVAKAALLLNATSGRSEANLPIKQKNLLTGRSYAGFTSCFLAIPNDHRDEDDRHQQDFFLSDEDPQAEKIAMQMRNTCKLTIRLFSAVTDNALQTGNIEYSVEFIDEKREPLEFIGYYTLTPTELEIEVGGENRFFKLVEGLEDDSVSIEIDFDNFLFNSEAIAPRIVGNTYQGFLLCGEIDSLGSPYSLNYAMNYSDPTICGVRLSFGEEKVYIYKQTVKSSFDPLNPDKEEVRKEFSYEQIGSTIVMFNGSLTRPDFKYINISQKFSELYTNDRGRLFLDGALRRDTAALVAGKTYSATVPCGQIIRPFDLKKKKIFPYCDVTIEFSNLRSEKTENGYKQLFVKPTDLYISFADVEITIKPQEGSSPAKRVRGIYNQVGAIVQIFTLNQSAIAFKRINDETILAPFQLVYRKK